MHKNTWVGIIFRCTVFILSDLQVFCDELGLPAFSIHVSLKVNWPIGSHLLMTYLFALPFAGPSILCWFLPCGILRSKTGSLNVWTTWSWMRANMDPKQVRYAHVHICTHKACAVKQRLIMQTDTGDHSTNSYSNSGNPFSLHHLTSSGTHTDPVTHIHTHFLFLVLCVWWLSLGEDIPSLFLRMLLQKGETVAPCSPPVLHFLWFTTW